MSFSAEWLALREPVDHAARDKGLLEEINRLSNHQKILRLTDIGSGTGSTIRAVKPALDSTVIWHLVDHDAALLEIAAKEAGSDEVILSKADLSTSLEAVFSQPTDLITTSAFLDLVSRDWLQNFVNQTANHNLPVYAALTYDGRAGCLPALEDDEIILNAFNRHQKTDKGFGEALGPDAASYAVHLFEEAGYEVITALSDWRAGPEHAAFQRMLLDGWRDAAGEIRPDLHSDFNHWFKEREALINNSQKTGASVFVGHIDFLALAPA